MLLKNLLTYRQLLHRNASLLLGIQLWAFACCFFPSSFLHAAMFSSKTPTASAHRESERLASRPRLAPHRCLLANIQLPGNVESALLLFHLIFLTPCSRFVSSAAPAVLAFPRTAELGPAAICAFCEVPVAALPSAALPGVFTSRAFQTNMENQVTAAASDNSIHGGGGVVPTQGADLGSHSAPVTSIVGRLFSPSEDLSVFNCKEKVMSLL